MSNLSRIGIGAAQFGQHYGISNRHGQPSEREVAGILERAIEAGVNLFDTAEAYGDAEYVIGRYVPPNHTVRIVTKTPPVRADSVEAVDRERWLDAIAASLERLGVASVHGVLIHR